MRDHTSEDGAQNSGPRRISKLRYGNGDYFWINDLGPMIMHPLKPELNGQDVTENKDPTGKRLFFDVRQCRKSRGRRLRRISMAKAWQGRAAAEAVLCNRL